MRSIAQTDVIRILAGPGVRGLIQPSCRPISDAGGAYDGGVQRGPGGHAAKISRSPAGRAATGWAMRFGGGKA